ncbi:MAG: hypothetical protein HDQ88_05835 [Clostridia bacterium]|nr:hypothetical protein [Clostridia bacterium]
MKFTPDRSNVTDKWTEIAYFEELAAVKKDFYKYDDPMKVLTDHVAMFRRTLIHLAYGIADAARYYHKETEFKELVSDMWSLVCMMTLPKDVTTSDEVFDMALFGTVLREIYVLNHEHTFYEKVRVEHMPVFAAGIQLTMGTVLSTIGPISDSMNPICEMLAEITQESEVIAA